MRRTLVLLALVLLALTALAPVGEAFADCQVECAGGGSRDCGTDDCCSCCPAARFVLAFDAVAPPPALSGRAPVVAPPAPRDADPRAILHVPRLRPA